MALELPRIIYGSSALGNLYGIVPDETKLSIVANWLQHQKDPVIDSAGKYGAGLALENIGRFLKELNVAPDAVRISNKLGWKRVPLTSPEPTFEEGAWFGLEHDAAQHISYDGILECYEQGNELLGDYTAQILSVHDPDEYLAAATNEADASKRYEDILGAYRALGELRTSGKAQAVGVGSKDWRVIQRLYEDGIALDWVMFANSYTVLTHPEPVMELMQELHQSGVTIINSAVFNAGFLIGGRYFDYQIITPETHPDLFAWRERFTALCAEFRISPALACCQFALKAPGVQALALNTSKPERVADNVALVNDEVPEAFWHAMKEHQLVDANYAYC